MKVFRKVTKMTGDCDYGAVVVGAGIAGATTALALSQAGIKVLVIESGSHPRFAIGESTIPTTTLLFDAVGKKWNIPELRNLTRYVPWKKLTPSGADFPKSHFWFGLHEENKRLEISHELLLETVDPPLGPDTHILREKFDEYLVSLFSKYKVEYLDKTIVEEYSYDENQKCHLKLKSHVSGESRQVSCRFIVDASGHSAFFSRKLGYFEENKEQLSLKTNTRSIYGHFKLTSLPDLDDQVGGPCLLYRQKRNAGTMHHCFQGGWIWVIPFDEETVSVGIVLNREIYPEQPDISAKEEFYSIINRFPTIKAHLGNLEPVRPFIRKARLQIMSKSILGNGVIITPHAAAFIDALFSSGILMTITFVHDFVPLASNAFKSNIFSMKQFSLLEEMFFRNIHMVDTIVSGTIESFRDVEVFKQFGRAWVCAASYDFVYTAIMRDEKINPKLCGIFGSNNDLFRQDVENAWTTLMQSKKQDQLVVATQLKKIMDRHWLFCKNHPYEHHLGEIGSRFPFKIVAKLTYKDFVKDLIKTEKENISFLKTTGRAIKLLFRVTLLHSLRKRLHTTRIDKRRYNILEAQKLPWYDVDLLK